MIFVLYRRNGGVFYIIELELGEDTTVPLLIFHFCAAAQSDGPWPLFSRL
jgi:hypothetical protein